VPTPEVWDDRWAERCVGQSQTAANCSAISTATSMITFIGQQAQVGEEVGTWDRPGQLQDTQNASNQEKKTPDAVLFLQSQLATAQTEAAANKLRVMQILEVMEANTTSLLKRTSAALEEQPTEQPLNGEGLQETRIAGLEVQLEECRSKCHRLDMELEALRKDLAAATTVEAKGPAAPPSVEAKGDTGHQRSRGSATTAKQPAEPPSVETKFDTAVNARGAPACDPAQALKRQGSERTWSSSTGCALVVAEKPTQNTSHPDEGCGAVSPASGPHRTSDENWNESQTKVSSNATGDAFVQPQMSDGRRDDLQLEHTFELLRTVSDQPQEPSGGRPKSQLDEKPSKQHDNECTVRCSRTASDREKPGRRALQRRGSERKGSSSMACAPLVAEKPTHKTSHPEEGCKTASPASERQRIADELCHGSRTKEECDVAGAASVQQQVSAGRRDGHQPEEVLGVTQVATNLPQKKSDRQTKAQPDAEGRATRVESGQQEMSAGKRCQSRPKEVQQATADASDQQQISVGKRRKAVGGRNSESNKRSQRALKTTSVPARAATDQRSGQDAISAARSHEELRHAAIGRVSALGIWTRRAWEARLRCGAASQAVRSVACSANTLGSAAKFLVKAMAQRGAAACRRRPLISSLSMFGIGVLLAARRPPSNTNTASHVDPRRQLWRSAYLAPGSLLSMADRDRNGYTALHYAASEGYPESVHELLAWMQSDLINAQGGEDWSTALHIAAYYGNAEASRALLASPRFISVAATDRHGRTALHRAAQSGHAGVVAALLDSKRVQPIVDRRYRHGYTALHIAAWLGQAVTARILAVHPSFQGSVCAVDGKGLTASEVASRFGFGDIAAELRRLSNCRKTVASEGSPL